MTRRRAFSSVLSVALLLPACGALVPACKNEKQPAAPPAVVRQPAAHDAAAPAPAAPPAPVGPAVVIDTGERRLNFRVELARTLAERERGLMFRDRLAADTGMLFVFERPGPLTFWMKNTRIPLDMIFISQDRRIVGIVANAEPETLSPRRVEGLSQYVLEIGGGVAGQLGVHAGQRVEFREIPGLP